MTSVRSEYNTVATYNKNRRFGDVSERLLDDDNASLCMTSPYCSPSFERRTQIHQTQNALFAPVDRTIQKDVWGPGTCCLRQSLLQTELDQGWTVFQRRTFKKTPVLWIREATVPTDPGRRS